mmetsp:Transcript_36028/g.47517  ORF Transcript_36028/g.47517 Transcript_36028/m.47517 type:complete len:169 (-) Transcript_36028:485-991(-)
MGNAACFYTQSSEVRKSVKWNMSPTHENSMEIPATRDGMQPKNSPLAQTERDKAQGIKGEKKEEEEEGEDEYFNVGELVEIHQDRLSSENWVEGMVRNVLDNGRYDIQTLFYTFGNVPSENVRSLGEERLGEILNAKCTPMTEENLRTELRNMCMENIPVVGDVFTFS